MSDISALTMPYYQATVGRGPVASIRPAVVIRNVSISPRLTLIASASTRAVRMSTFPLDEGLDEFGWEVAAAMAPNIAGGATVLTSPARRAIETAEAFGLNAKVDHSLRDIDVGRWAGRKIKEVAELDPCALESWLSDPEAAPHGGETVEELYARIADWLKTISENRGRVVAITHPAVIRAAVLVAIRSSAASFWHIDVAHLSVVELSNNGKRWTLKSLRS